ncbi:hypothetical protein [Halodurantibacterium flavum]|uniref:Uncharacterized protein n=1 Tax=Halodurantibacterium flavum TaxID=1382802 RepID=A0ABW4S0D7_9RHOB
MKAKALSLLACGAFMALQAHAQSPAQTADAQDTLPLDGFFTQSGDEIALTDDASFASAWQGLEAPEREMIAADCTATLDVGAEVPAEASATGDVADLPEVESVAPDMQNEMESGEAAGATDPEVATLGPQRRALAGQDIPAETWVEFCEAVQRQAD